MAPFFMPCASPEIGPLVKIWWSCVKWSRKVPSATQNPVLASPALSGMASQGERSPKGRSASITRPRFPKKNRPNEASNLRPADQARVEPQRAKRSSQKAKVAFKKKEGI
jgi:hypothetical protein